MQKKVCIFKKLYIFRRNNLFSIFEKYLYLKQNTMKCNISSFTAQNVVLMSA